MTTHLLPLTDDHELCQWDGPLLPLEPIDYDQMIDHGTDRGYQQHRKWNIPYCGDCQQAHRERRRHERNAA